MTPMVRRLAWLLILPACNQPADNDDDNGSTDEPPQIVDTFGSDTETEDDGGGLGLGGGGDDEETDDPGGFIECTRPSSLGLEHICDLSVNDANATLITAGDDHLALSVQMSATPPPVGGFNSLGGRGNRSLAGFHGYSRLDLDALGPITMDAKKQNGNFGIEVAIQVDLTCDNGPFALLIAAHDDLPTPIDQGDGWGRYTADPTAAVWSALDDLARPDDPEIILLHDPNSPDGSPASLSAMRGAYPDACVRNFDAGFTSLPAAPTVSSGILLTLGSHVQYQSAALWRVRRVSIGDDVHTP